MINIYKQGYDKDWPKYFDKLDNAIKEQVAKKIPKILEHPERDI